MNRVCPCRICNEVGHSSSKCPCLTEDTKSGFYSGGGGGGGHSHDDDDETIGKKLNETFHNLSVQFRIYTSNEK